jgi:hypothetical protein
MASQKGPPQAVVVKRVDKDQVVAPVPPPLSDEVLACSMEYLQVRVLFRQEEEIVRQFDHLPDLDDIDEAPGEGCHQEVDQGTAAQTDQEDRRGLFLNSRALIIAWL